ncbi:MAG: VOC family protein [Calditrichae bacterium]|nr:VOC family protein [Calditrichia bacterium]
MKKLIIFSLILIAVMSCSTKKIIVPPVTEAPTNNYLEGKFVWHDLLTDKVPEVKKFYGELFDWEFEGDDDPKAKYTLIKHQGKPIGGIVYTDLKEDLNESQWLSYLSVSDVDVAAKFVENHGGTIHRKAWNLKNRGRVAVVADAQEALFVLLHANGGDPPDQEPEINMWLWNELFASDDEAALNFYKGLAGYTHESHTVRDTASYHVMKKGEKSRAGIILNPFDGVRPNWLPYVRVKDPAALTEKVESLGGKVFLAPREDIRKGSVGLIIDPSGAAVAIQRWPF